jgi:hypothetical protein
MYAKSLCKSKIVPVHAIKAYDGGDMTALQS